MDFRRSTVRSKTFPSESIPTEISPLRFASVEMTKGRVVLPGIVVAAQKPFFISLDGAPGTVWGWS